jgi:short subunit fatty acids transporter
MQYPIVFFAFAFFYIVLGLVLCINRKLPYTKTLLRTVSHSAGVKIVFFFHNYPFG